MEATCKDDSPLIGQAAGVYGERPVLRSLRPHFLSAWFHYKPPGCARRTAVVPDACADLIWFGGNLLVAGPDRKVSFEFVPPGSTVVGLRFQPGALAPWLSVPANEIVGERLPLECFWRSHTQRLLDSIGDAQEPEVVTTRLQAGLDRMARHVDSPDRSPKMILKILRAIQHSNRPITRLLTSALGASERTLRRNCEHAFGYGPKTLDRVLRMQRFLELARTRYALEIADLAGIAGYADQAHLTRETRRLTGLTPTAILTQLFESRRPPADENGTHKGATGNGGASSR